MTNRRTHRQDLVPVNVGHENPGGDGTVALGYDDESGQAFLWPAALRMVEGEQKVAALELQSIARQIHQLQRVLDEAVNDARASRLSWQSIGWCLGTSGEAARQRFGPPPASRPARPRRPGRRRG